MKTGTKIFMAAGGAFVVLAAGVVYMTTGAPRLDEGGDSPSAISGQTPNITNDPMQPVGQEEASRRATANDQKAQETTKPGESSVAQPVIAEELNLRDEDPNNQLPPKGIALPEVRPLKSTDIQIPERVVVQNAADPAKEQQVRDQAAADQARRDRDTQRRNQYGGMVQAQLDKLLDNNAPPTINVQAYKEPPKPVKASSGASGSGTSGNGSAASARAAGPIILAAKPGDTFYATLKVGFNSDDPQGLPAFATIHDQRADGSYGPLHGGVLAGNVTYSPNQAAVTFRQMTLRDGRTGPVQAMAATLKDVRPGVATSVDKHTLQRYSGLVVASLFQGLGMAGQQILSNDTTRTITDNAIIVSGPEKLDWTKIGLASALPLGQNLSSAFSQSFNRPATIASPAGSEVAIVFLQQVTVEPTK